VIYLNLVESRVSTGLGVVMKRDEYFGPDLFHDRDARLEVGPERERIALHEIPVGASGERHFGARLLQEAP